MPTSNDIGKINESAPKRKLGETSPEPTLHEVMNAIHQSNAKIGQQLANVATKDDIRELTSQFAYEVDTLRNENEALRNEIGKLKAERAADRKELNKLIQQAKSKNLVFRGMAKSNDAKELVEKLCKEKLTVQNANVKSARVLVKREEKEDVLAVFESEEVVNEILKNTKKLVGSTISIEKDMTEEQLQDKKVLLQLKKNITAIDATKKKKIAVRNDSIKICDKWMHFNINKKLVQGKQEISGNDLKELLGLQVLIDIDYYQILEKAQQKNHTNETPTQIIT